MKAAQALENTPAWQQTPWRDPGQQRAAQRDGQARLWSRRGSLPRIRRHLEAGGL